MLIGIMNRILRWIEHYQFIIFDNSRYMCLKPIYLSLCFPRYASLYFCCAIEAEDNELLTLEVIHRYVELLDKYFGSVSMSDLLLNSAICMAFQQFSQSIDLFTSMSCNIVGMRTRYYLQLWESLFYAGWASARWRSSRDQ